MTDQPLRILPAFAPVPRDKDRSNGWKPEVQRAFIEALAETGSVAAACRRVNRADHGAYLLRRHPEAEEFRRAWDAALDIGMRRIEDIAMDRALHGVEQPVYSYGKLIGTRRVYNDRLLMFMLRNRAPERFAGGKSKAPNAVDTMQLARLKKQWRAEWESQRTTESDTQAQGHGDALLARIGAMHHRWYTRLGPQSRAAYRQFRMTESTEERARRELDADLRDREARQAEAEYAEWFDEERRARVWWVIDVVFGAVSEVERDEA